MPTELEAAIAATTAQGQPYETCSARIRGVDFTVFANAPENLRALYRSGLAHADKDFYVYEGERYTYQRMWDLAAQCANRLRERGFAAGDRVGIALRNYPEWIAAFMGITGSGCVAVAMNAWWSGDELEYGIQDSGLKLLFSDVERTERLRDRAARLGVELVTVRHRGDGFATWEEFLGGASTRMPEPVIRPEDNATILYTSGSTAHPKGVLSTHRAIANALLGWGVRRRHRDGDESRARRRGWSFRAATGASAGGDSHRAALPRDRAGGAAAVVVSARTQGGGHVQVGCAGRARDHRNGTDHRVQRRADHGVGAGAGAEPRQVRSLQLAKRGRRRCADGPGTRPADRQDHRQGRAPAPAGA